MMAKNRNYYLKTTTDQKTLDEIMAEPKQILKKEQAA